MSKVPQDDLSSLVGHDLTPRERTVQLAQQMRWQAMRMFLTGCALLFIIVAGVLAMSRTAVEPLAGLLPPGLALAVAALSLLGLWKLPRRHGEHLVLTLMGLIIGLTVLIAVSRALGLYALSLTVMGLMVALAVTLLGLRSGLLLAGLGALALVGLAGDRKSVV